MRLCPGSQKALGVLFRGIFTRNSTPKRKAQRKAETQFPLPAPDCTTLTVSRFTPVAEHPVDLYPR